VLGPDKPIVLTLDLHANITGCMVALADAIVGYHTYPHIDMFETGQKAARLMLRILRGACTPAMAFRKIPLLLCAENAQTYSGPMGRLIKRAKSMKAEAVSVFQVQPWMDIDEMGSAVVSVTNGNLNAAQKQADELARKMWDTKAEFAPDLVSVPDAIERAMRVEGGPVVFAESSDSTGSGSPGDSTGVLRHLPRDVSSAIFLVDPWAVAKAVEAGIGKRVKMAIGGCYDKRNSKPVRVNGYVRMISDGRWTAQARGYNTGIETSMGRTVVLEVGQIKVLIAEKSAMTVDPELFRSHGIEPLYRKIVVVKSPLGFRAAYEPLAKAMYVVDTPGVSTARLERMPWKRISRPIYPLDKDVTFP
jgi:microcystin degradation protein MlrC